MSSKIVKVISDIRFWIILFAFVRLYGITNPPLEVAHSWRQVTVNMVARNFVENGANILYPQVDMAGEKSGITGMEFPLLNYLIYLMSKLFGFHHWYGRLINLMISSIGIYYFYKIIRQYFTEKIAFQSSIILLSSIWFAYSRKIMPDTFSVSLVIIGLYYFSQFICSWKTIHYLLTLMYLSLGILSKLPAGFMLVFAILMMFPFKNYSIKRLISVISIIFVIFMLIYFWYFYWVPHLVNEYGYWHFFMGTSFGQGAIELVQNLNLTVEKFYFDALKYSGFILFLVGFIICLIHKKKRVLWIFTLGILAFCSIVLKAGKTFSLHSYYIVPFVPIMALVASHALFYIKNKTLVNVILALVVLEGVLNQIHDFNIREQEMHVLTLESIVNQNIPVNSHIVINGDINPTDLYYTHRKGWTLANEQIQLSSLDSLANLGCNYLIWDKKKEYSPLFIKYKKEYEDNNYSIYFIK